MAQLLENKEVTVRELAGQMEVSDATVRRDLKALADEQELELHHGGATLSPNCDYSYHAKSLRASAEKQIIGRLAGELLQDGDHIFLDSGTTCSQLVPYVKRLLNMTLLANSSRLALELKGSNSRLFLIGGEYRPHRMDTVGPMAQATLKGVRGYVAFIGADGLSMDFGPSASDVDSAHLHRIVVENAKSTVLLVDHTKLGNPSLFQIAEWDRISKVVTDRAPDGAWKEFLEQRGIELLYPSSKQTAIDKVPAVQES